ncbi:MAG: hypothetical protein K0S33_1690 [Bacteroidetes bacterium]|jgi:DNA-binding CsgD family transcriptional regulator|nr:hypothetical protein [Bacteroidota bacterium]
MKESTIAKYLETLSVKLRGKYVINGPVKDISNFPLAVGQFFYIIDYQKREITYQKGVKEILGYEPHEFNFDLVIGYFHPEDYDMVTRLIKATLMFASENNVSKDVGYFVTCRIRKKDGNYLKVLRQSNVFDIDEKGKIISNTSLMTDISFIDNSKQVQWEFHAPGLDKEKFRQYVTKEYSGFFSDRELEVLRLLKQGKKSAVIADELCISKHTVDGHRRKMLSKSNCENTIDLINFSKSNGIL